MILDYAYDSRKKNFSISYIKEDGMKSLLNFNVSRFKAFYKTPTGRYKNWDGSNCDERWTDRPSKFEYKTFMKELDPKYKSLLAGKYNPKLYTFDIETMVVDDEFPEPSEAKFPITTISIANPNCDVIILGTRVLDEVGQEYLQNEFSKYVKDTEFFHTLGLKLPAIKYVYFESEEAMLRYFLKNIVSKVPVLGGWNSLLFDWQYIQNRVRFYYHDISLASCSTSYTTHRKNYKDKKEQTVTLTLPDHTLVVDMMDVIDQFDMVVMPIKDSLSLDYIASESIGANKIKYDGSLDDLYNNDYAKYVFYNAIDSFLVQLIDRKFKTLNIICTQSLVCHEKIESCFSKIAITEAMFWHYFYDSGIKCVYENKEDVERGTLVGAYVRTPTPGKHNFICCNDFASLYPSTIITCNLSIENFVGTFYDEKALAPYKADLTNYIVVGGSVYKNKGTLTKPSLGEFIRNYLLEDELDIYRKDPNYFVSVNGSVYKNDKDYAFRCIQNKLKNDRNISKYLAKQLEAEVITDVDHIKKGYTIKSSKTYSENIIKAIAGLGYNVNMAADMMVWDPDILNEFERRLKNEITYLTSAEQAYKLIGNSCYGGSSHVAFFWFNMALANDITGEARNIIHKMESHIPTYMKDTWPTMSEFHKKHNIELDKSVVKNITGGNKSFVNIAYGDSCVGETIIQTINGPVMIKDMFNESNIVFHDRGKDFGLFNDKIINYNGHQNIESNIKYIIRHKTSKSKWIITDDQHNEIIVTGDHSMIVIEDSIMKFIKPSEMKVGMILRTIDSFSKVISVINDGNFDNEYVYDIEVYTNNDNEHNFYGNNILIHNTDSITGDSIIHTSEGDKTIEQLFEENTDSMFLTHKGHELVKINNKVLNWDNKLYFGNVNYVMRHKVSKPKWRLKTKDGKEIIMTNDHSMIVFRDGQKLEVKPYEILPTDKVLSVHNFNN